MKHCHGISPLDAILAPWMIDLIDAPARIASLVAEHGSPVNVMNVEPMRNTISRLSDAGHSAGIDLQIHFARKANKCARWVDVAIESGIGLDIASELELEQTIDCYRAAGQTPPPSSILCTAAIKSAGLLRRCLEHDVVIVIDNSDELHQLNQLASTTGSGESDSHRIAIAFRMGEFPRSMPGMRSRFGMSARQITELAHSLSSRLKLSGIHFHLQRTADDFEPSLTSALIDETALLIDSLRGDGHAIEWLDIGGGLPINYLTDPQQWLAFWQRMDAATQRQQPAITRDNLAIKDVDPMWQPRDAATWLGEVLRRSADTIRSRRLTLKCEPGRSLLDGCGMTIAEVAFVKTHSSGDQFIGLQMNRSQCQTTRDEFLVDPILVRRAPLPDVPKKPTEGYLVGGYCTESEFLMRRKFIFPRGIARGDHLVFPNTAAYQMHFAESRAHQSPLATNVFVGDSPTSFGK